MNLAEQMRAAILNHSLSLKTVRENWSVRRHIALSKLGEESVNGRALLDIGDHLSDMFRCMGAGDRSQDSLSGGGSVWAALVAWYLNLAYAGTDAIVYCGGKFLPKCLKDAMAVSHAGHTVSADLDVVVVSIPEISGMKAQDTPQKCAKEIARKCEDSFNTLGMVVVQCKTNWNDNAQVPMLWNLLYGMARRGTIPHGLAVLGKNNWNLRNLGYFAYAFVTVPTSSGGPDGFTSNLLPVLRSSLMTGGYYWGYPTKNGVCRSIKEFFNHQYAAAGSSMPNVQDLGIAYASELSAPTGRCDLASFSLHRIYSDATQLLHA